MQYLIDQLFSIVMIIIVCLFIVIALILIGIIIYMYNKKNRKEEDEYHQSLNRYDAKDFLDFEDIVDQMIIMDHHSRFVALIRCYGFDYYAASSVQQDATIQGFQAFLNTIPNRIAYRQIFVPRSMDYTRNMYNTRYEEVVKQLYFKTMDHEQLVEKLNQVNGIDLVAEDRLISEAVELQKEIDGLKWRRDHLKSQIVHMDAVCGQDMELTSEEYYVVEWEYHPTQYSIELTEEEIHRKAIEELDGICSRLIGALGGCNVRGYRCTTEEIAEVIYRYTHPYSSAEFKMPSIMNSPYFEDYITSNDGQKKRDAAYRDIMLEGGIQMSDDLLDAADTLLSEM